MCNNGLYQGELFEYFGGMKDTRQQGKVWHQLTDILFIVTAGVMCGYDEMDDIYIWANANSSQSG